jgi:hypothetical protein
MEVPDLSVADPLAGREREVVPTQRQPVLVEHASAVVVEGGAGHDPTKASPATTVNADTAVPAGRQRIGLSVRLVRGCGGVGPAVA